MSTAYITEHAGTLDGSNIVEVPKIVNNNVAITAGSLASNPFNANTAIVRITVDAACSVKFSQDPGLVPVATVADMRLAIGDTHLFGVRPGDIVAVIANP
jgi:hypothetical protein